MLPAPRSAPPRRTRLLPLAAALAVAAGAARAAEPAPAVLLDEVIARVETRPITRSELELLARLGRARALGPAHLADAVPPGELTRVLGRLVDELVVFTEANRLQVFEVAEGEVDRALAELRQRLGSAGVDGLLEEFDLDERDLKELLRRELRVARYLEGRFRLASRPRDAEVQAALAAVGEMDPSAPREDAEAVRARLARERFAALTREFVSDLRRRSRVQVLRDPAAAESSAPRWGTVSAAEVGERAQRSPGRESSP